jgi:hypothetical protein
MNYFKATKKQKDEWTQLCREGIPIESAFMRSGYFDEEDLALHRRLTMLGVPGGRTAELPPGWENRNVPKWDLDASLARLFPEHHPHGIEHVVDDPSHLRIGVVCSCEVVDWVDYSVMCDKYVPQVDAP